MKLRIVGLACLFAVAGMGVARARLDPTPPPSGIVIHLFGPDSVMQSVAPALAAAPGAAASRPGSTPAAAAAAEPGWGPVLREMFVTGDPDAPNQPPRGKTGHQLAD